MRRYIVLFITVPLLLGGCWDQTLLKDAKLIHSISLDSSEEGVRTTVSIPTSNSESARSLSGVTVRIVSSQGKNVKESRMNLDRKTTEQLSISKNKVLLLSDELLDDHIYSYLDVFYRDPRSALNSKIAVTEGKAEELIRLPVQSVPLISQYLTELIYSAEKNSLSPKMNIQFLCSLIFNKGQDYVLPSLKKTDEDSAEISGLAMFHKEGLTGYLNTEEALILVLMMDEKGENAKFTETIGNKETGLLNNVAFEVMKMKRDIHISAGPVGKWKVNLKLDLKVNITEYPENSLDQEKTALELNQKLSSILTKRAKEVISKTQEANCDAIGIGLRVNAFHHDRWKELDWEKEYPEIEINPVVKVEIIKHGIIN